MLCEKCEIREANIKYTEVFNGVKTEHNLCAQCAKEMDSGTSTRRLIDGRISAWENCCRAFWDWTDASASQAPKVRMMVCPTCGHNVRGVCGRTAVSAAPDCYHVFDPLLGEKIKKLQGNSTAIPAKHPRIQTAQSGGPCGEVTKRGELEFSPEEQIKAAGNAGWKRRLQVRRL